MKRVFKELIRVITKKVEFSDGLEIKGQLRITKIDSQTGKVKSVGKWNKNIIVSSNTYGKNIVSRQLIGDTTYPLEIDTAAIGDDNTVPTINDIALGNAVLSGIIPSTREINVNITTFKWFITTGSLPDGTYEEFGMFMNGRLFSRALFADPYVKSTGEDTLVEYVITL